MLPISFGDLKTKLCKLRVNLRRRVEKLLACACDPLCCFFGPARFTKRIDQVQMSALSAFTIRILFRIQTVAISGFSRPTHAQSSGGAEVQPLASIQRLRISFTKTVVD